MKITEKVVSPYELESIEKEIERMTSVPPGLYWYGKRAFDLIFSLVLLILGSPFLLIISIAIFIDDPHGSPFYSQIRIGKNGVPFKMLKFRTMVVGAEKMKADFHKQNEADGPVFKMKYDPRITRVGRFLRKYSIDEIPQLFNVINGTMSVVGPRPALPDEVEQYTEFDRLRLMVTPGLTCIWQTRFDRHRVLFVDWVKMDIDYIYRRSWSFDLYLIFKTIAVVIKGTSE